MTIKTYKREDMWIGGPVMESLTLIVLEILFFLGNSEWVHNWIRVSVKINLRCRSPTIKGRFEEACEERLRKNLRQY